MNREDIIRMAEQASAIHYWHLSILERFAALVAAAERNRTWTQEHWTEYERNIAAAAKAEENEACAQFLESTHLGSLPDDTALHYARLLKGFAEGIRARKENTRAAMRTSSPSSHLTRSVASVEH